MKYRKLGKTGKDVSILGYGCMRFPCEDGKIVQNEAINLLHHAIENGVNYLDTAYFYHDAQSESLVGEALKGGYREKVFVATKSPVYSIEKADDFERFLDIQLKRLQTDHIDFYLLHALSKNYWHNVVQKFDILSRLQKAKDDGIVGNIGFSFHDDFDAFIEITDGFDGWDFCQLQLNYVDVFNQAKMAGMEYAAQKNLGVIIMEPLRGGRLANPPERIKSLLPAEKTPVEWALDFLWDRPEVSTILSGMSNLEQVNQNLEYADNSHVGMLSAENHEMFEKMRMIYETAALNPCTQCGYCMPCPKKLDIPRIYELYNMSALGNQKKLKEKYEELSVKADACVSCKQCEFICPQGIKSSSEMPKIAKFFNK